MGARLPRPEGPGGRFENPRDVAFLNGKVYAASTGYNRVQVLDVADGTVDSVWVVDSLERSWG